MSRMPNGQPQRASAQLPDDSPIFFHNDPELDAGEGEAEEMGESELDSLRQQVSQTQAQAQDASLSTRLLADPNIREYLTAMQNGKKVKLVADEPSQQQQVEEVSEPENWDEMSNKDVAAYTTKKVATEVRKILQTDFVAPLTQQLQGFDQRLQQIESQGVQSSLASLREKYPDFDNYRQDMILLNNQYEGRMPPEDLYLFAKAKRGDASGLPQRQQLGVESPTVSSSRPRRSGPANMVKNGKVGFKNILGSALSNMDFNR